MPGRAHTDRPARRSRDRTPPVWRRLRTGVLSALAAYLVFLHAELLLRRIESLTLFEPLVALRWLVGLVVLAAMFRLRRSGESLVGGRPATVVWLLVLVLHAQAAPPAAAQPLAEPPSEAAHLLLALPAAISAVGLLRLALPLIGAAARRRPRGRLGLLAWRPTLAGPDVSSGFSFPLLSRPPPA